MATTAMLAGGGAHAADAGAPPPAEHAWASCVEHIPPGATAPTIREQFPERGMTGHALPLRVRIEHGKGEVVLPQGFQVQRDSDAARALEASRFVVPETTGSAAPTSTTTVTGTTAVTELTLYFVPLPPTPGRARLTLPPVPIAVARASGELVTVCTQPHTVVVDDPTASVLDPKPRPNPDPRSQREEWTLAKQVTIGAAIGAVLAALAAWFIVQWRKRPRPVPPPPPPRPPWEVALEELYAIRHAGLVRAGRLAEHFDRVSDSLRKYLGGRYGFDGLETTTDEMLRILRGIEQPKIAELPSITQVLRDSDLVKFARFSPTEEDCEGVLRTAESIVHATLPTAESAQEPPRAQGQAREGTADDPRDRDRPSGWVRDDTSRLDERPVGGAPIVALGSAAPASVAAASAALGSAAPASVAAAPADGPDAREAKQGEAE